MCNKILEVTMTKENIILDIGESGFGTLIPSEIFPNMKDKVYLAGQYFKDLAYSTVINLKTPIKIIAASITIAYEGYKLVNMKPVNTGVLINSGNELLTKYYIYEIKSIFSIISASYGLKANFDDLAVEEYSNEELDDYSNVDYEYTNNEVDEFIF